MWNLGKWYRWTYLQSRNTDTDIEKKSMDTKGEGGGGRNWKIGIDIYTLLIPCIPRDLPEPGIEPASPALAGGFFTTKPPGKW